ncbi:hypothetical protein ACFQ1M_00485 [Sungkyunkwania multivorans]|uniref:Uncharacterized protein n=1 Tax=Sungkyunkwania multivorans TaxID=1173618 RepID=A0ABW3CSJ8_9FLAO
MKLPEELKEGIRAYRKATPWYAPQARCPPPLDGFVNRSFSMLEMLSHQNKKKACLSRQAYIKKYIVNIR